MLTEVYKCECGLWSQKKNKILNDSVAVCKCGKIMELGLIEIETHNFASSIITRHGFDDDVRRIHPIKMYNVNHKSIPKEYVEDELKEIALLSKQHKYDNRLVRIYK